MNTKLWFYISYMTTMVGWFPFMWVSVYASWNREVGAFVLCIGILVCMFGALSMLFMMGKDELFKSMDELGEEKQKYIEARKKLEQKIDEFIKE